jgi:hypothetical protein
VPPAKHHVTLSGFGAEMFFQMFSSWGALCALKRAPNRKNKPINILVIAFLCKNAAFVGRPTITNV